MKHPHRNGRAKIRQDRAAERQSAYDALTREQKIALAKQAPGSAKRQLARLGVSA